LCLFVCHQTLPPTSRLQLGLVSRSGWVVVDDSETALWDGDEAWPWRVPRNASGLDYYLFAHGLNFTGALQDFVHLAGPVPLKPWRAHGVWHSREMAITEEVVHQVVGAYQAYALPLNFMVLDYGWHVGPYDPQRVNTTCHQPEHAGGQCIQGYGGYVWDSTYFPNPPAFQQWVHEDADLQLLLNIHDQCGIDRCGAGCQA
jgi:alpha-glucosidase (family GH31 glycosyl hydrolase)